MKKFNILALGAVLLGSGMFASCDKSNTMSKVSLIPVQISKEKWSFVDKNGNVVFEDEFKSAPTAVYNGVFSVREKEDLYSVYKVGGDKYDVLGELEGLKNVGYMEEGLIPVCFPRQRIAVYTDKGEKKFEINPVGGEEVKVTGNAYSEGMLTFRLSNGKRGYFDAEGKVAIKATYDRVSEFCEGLALVAVKAENASEYDDDYKWSVIDKNGETVFKFKDGQEPRTYFNHGYVIVRDDDRDLIYDRKGEVTKLPKKINRIHATDGKYVIFSDDSDDRKMGVCTMEGEVLIRPKYNQIVFNNVDIFKGSYSGSGDKFIAIDDDETVLLDRKGKELQEFDFKEGAFPMGQFGYMGYDGKRYSLVDRNGKEKCKDDFHDINLALAPHWEVESDFFDYAGVANVVAGLVNGDKVGQYTLGSTPGAVVSDSPSYSYYYQKQVDLDGINKSADNYKITAVGFFNKDMATRSYGDYYEYYYSWDPTSNLYDIVLILETEGKWGEEGKKALVDAFKAKGFTVDKEGYYGGSEPAALMTSGNIAIMITSEGESGANIQVLDKTLEGVTYAYENLRNSITSTKDSSAAVQTYDNYAQVDSVAVTDYSWDYAPAEEEVAAEAPAADYDYYN